MKKNLLLLIPNLDTGGAQRVYYNHSIELTKKFNVYECVFNLREGHAFVSGNPVLDLKVDGGGSIIAKVYNFYRRCRRVAKIKKQYNIDICISHLEGADYVNILSRGKEKIILCIHGSKIFDKNIKGVLGWIRKKILIPQLYSKADKIVAVSRDIKEELVHQFSIEGNLIEVINNFFYVDKLVEKAVEPLDEKFYSIFSSTPTLIHVGRLSIQKNQKPLFHIVKSLKQRSPVKLLILGDGELKEELMGEAGSCNLRVYIEGRSMSISDPYDVYFLGNQVNPWSFMSRSNIFLLPSAWEGFPMVLGEALACGVPIVSSDCPTGPEKFCQHKLQKKLEKIIAQNLLPMVC